MSDPTSLPLSGYDTGSTIRPLSVRMTDDLRAQLEIIAQLNNRSVTEEVRVGLEHWIQTSKSDPKVLARAETVRAEIEREAATKQSAIESVFANAPASKSGTERRSPKNGTCDLAVGLWGRALTSAPPKPDQLKL